MRGAEHEPFTVAGEGDEDDAGRVEGEEQVGDAFFPAQEIEHDTREAPHRKRVTGTHTFERAPPEPGG